MGVLLQARDVVMLCYGHLRYVRLELCASCNYVMRLYAG